MELKNGLLCAQRQILCQSQVQSLNILAMNNQELKDCLSVEYLENPLLDYAPSETDDLCTNIDSLYEKSVSYGESYSAWGEEDCRRKNDIPDKQPDMLKHDILMQLHRDCYTKDQWKLMEFLSECLDEEGFFPMEVSEAARCSGYPEEMVRICMDDLKNLEPVGIFSKDLSECLLKQLEQLGVEDQELLTIVRDYLPDILEGRIGNVTRALHLSTVSVRRYMLLIGKLNPRPIMDVQQGSTEYIVPDLIVTQKDGEWEVNLNDKWVGEYKLNDYYIRMMHSSKDAELASYFRERLEHARFIMSCVEQRRNTIVRIIQAIVEVQEPFFRKQGELQPMYLNDIAQKIEMHPSTVSRAIKGKYLQYQYGTVLVKNLFAASVLERDGQQGVSTEHIRNMLRTLIEKEDSKKPLSDMALVQELQKHSIAISRRTVAKYRAEMGIMNSDQRRYL